MFPIADSNERKHYLNHVFSLLLGALNDVLFILASAFLLLQTHSRLNSID